MNGFGTGSQLPDLNDEDVYLLHSICQRAADSNLPPYKSLFQAYDDIFNEQGIQQEHDSAILRWVMGIGEGARRTQRAHNDADLVGELNALLKPRGLQVTDSEHPEAEEDGDQPDGAHGTSIQEAGARQNGHPQHTKPGRRVSFGDAQVEETWLNDHSVQLHASPPSPAAPLLLQPPRRGRDFMSALHERRTQSASSQHDSVMRHTASKDSRFTPQSPGLSSGVDDTVGAELLYEPSQTQLEQNADAFSSTTDTRFARRCLHAWHDSTLRLHERSVQAYAIAAAHDRRELMRQSMDLLRMGLQDRIEQKRQAAYIEFQEERAQAKYENHILFKAFTHWVRMGIDARRENEVATIHLLRLKYFRRWKDIATDNALKTKLILCRKYVRMWRDTFAKNELLRQRAEDHFEEKVKQRCLQSLSWTMVEYRLEPWREKKVLRRTFAILVERWQARAGIAKQTSQQCDMLRKSKVITSLQRHLDGVHRRINMATQHHGQMVLRRTLENLKVQSKLAPMERAMALHVGLAVQHRTLMTWHQQTQLAQLASRVDRQRILHRAWTAWNDRLRITALAQSINERVLIENLYKWLLQTKLVQFQRWTAGGLLQRALRTWNSKTGNLEARLTMAQTAFAQHQRRRLMSTAVFRLNSTLRRREDDERTAHELANVHVLPKVLSVWKEKADHYKQLANWAADARWYCLCTSTIKVWRAKTTEHKHQRRKNAYATIRAKVKTRIAGQILWRWKTRTMEILSMNAEAGKRAHATLVNVGIQGFDTWAAKSLQYHELDKQAAAIDRQRLLLSALKALLDQQAVVASMDVQVDDFRQETELALIASALKKMQWATFTATRKSESADALRARNRDQHVRQMLRHWATRTDKKRTAEDDENDGRDGDQREPESPSLRPASRARARSVSRERAVPALPPAASSTTPAYMRSPSRSARARVSRFRPLPTPAPVMPMTFSSAYLATTPAPLFGEQALGNPANPFLQPAPEVLEGLTPQITPFARKLRAGGFTPAEPPPSALKRTFGKSIGGTGKSVRFVGASRFGSSSAKVVAENKEDR